MKLDITGINKTKTLQLLIKINHLNSNLNFHPLFFTYRNAFFSPTYNLLSSRISDLQLTYMDTIWDNTSVLKLRKRTLGKVNYHTQKLKIFGTKLSNLTQPQLLTLIFKPTGNIIISHLRSYLPSKYLNSYYSFLHTRVGFNKRNYVQKLHNWYLHSVKRVDLRASPHTTKKRLKYIRRGKARAVKKSYVGLSEPSTAYNQLIVTPRLMHPLYYNHTNSSLSVKRILIKGSTIPYHKSKYLQVNFKYKRNKHIKFTVNTNDPYLVNTIKLKLRIKAYYVNRTIRRYNKHFLTSKSLTHSEYGVSLHLYRSNFRTQLYKPSILISDKILNINPLQPIFPLDTLEVLRISTQSLKSFILRNSGIGIISQVVWKNKFPTKLKSQFKKKLFSFIFPGQSKKNVLIRRKKQVLTRLLSRSFKLITSIDKFSYRLFYQLFKTEQFMHKKNNLLHNYKNQHPLSYTTNLKNVYYNFDFDTKGVDLGDLHIHSEVRIPRVRFKPGYQRIWRQVRSALKVALNVKFQYQQQLTKYLVKFYHLSSQYLLSYSESTLDKIVIYSHLLPDMSTTELFNNHGFIYLNGNVNKSVNTIVIKNDLLQLVVSLWYYMITRWFLNWTNSRVRKFKRLVYRKNKPLQYRVMKTKKQQSYYTPNWIYQTRYDNTDIKPYLEVDFFTLSAFILTDTYIQYYHKIDDMPDLRNSTYMLYNWKYIT